MLTTDHNSRSYSDYALSTPAVISLLDILADPSTSIESYRRTMHQLGTFLAEAILTVLKHSEHDIFLVCTVEDADFLAQGVMDGLKSLGNRLKLICLWNSVLREEGVYLTPVIRQYKEPQTTATASFIIIKSIISSACVVKTNLTRAMSMVQVDQVIVASPVLLKGAQERLAQEFPKDIADKFEYLWLATDSQKNGDYVDPGVGGSVYERLGFVNEVEKNKYTPQIVKTRRAQHTVEV